VCDKKCGGNASQICGGSCSISVFKTKLQYQSIETNALSPNYIGCLPINSMGVGLENGLDLNMAQSIKKYPLTKLSGSSTGFYLVYPSSNYLKIETCIDICLELGFKYAGCGNK
jgi:hypothetical protein